ncbi:MAG: GNAT family N-acetyltransferase [Magnetococcales bacterium]|nr:GNAT family N-acetyltransferase [Magnetococcales bacterium]
MHQQKVDLSVSLQLTRLGVVGHWGEILAGLEPWKTLGSTATGLNRYLVQEDGALFRFVIGRQGQEVGILAIRYPWLRGPFIELLAIAPAFQQQGIASQVVEGIRLLTIPHCDNLWVTVSHFNQPARHFYQRQGFTEIALLPGLIRPGQEDWLLRRHPLQTKTS